MRPCGDCTLCCRLMPVRELPKGANERCKHQRWGKGCNIYATRPLPCRLWTCVWTLGTGNDMTEGLRRPDRCHYVIDTMPDFITLTSQAGEVFKPEVVQIWCDPKYPHAHRDPALRAYLERRDLPGLVRYDSKKGLILVPPNRAPSGQWEEWDQGFAGKEHDAEEVAVTLGYLPELPTTADWVLK